MSAKQIVVLGGGFAGLWSAVGAARKLDELGLGPEAVEVTLVSRDAFHNIRVRNYEADLAPARVPLDDVLGPVGVRRIEGEVAAIALDRQVVTIETGAGSRTLPYDRIVFALGSQLVRPPVPGLAESAFDIDTYGGALQLEHHLQSLPTTSGPEAPGQWTAVVVGAGLTGIEVAAELPGRLESIRNRAGSTRPVRVILADHNPLVGSDMGESARPIIEEALAALGVETRLGVEVAAVGPSGLTLRSDETIDAATVVWCAGMRANPLGGLLGIELDRFGRIPVDEFLRVRGVENVFAAGDMAQAMIDGSRASVMSCQHSRPMGRFAGHNVVADLLGQLMLPLRIDWYVTVLDLGPWGAVYTEGWDRHVVTKGKAAKKTKQIINCHRIYPPLNRNREEILAAAVPVIQARPQHDPLQG